MEYRPTYSRDPLEIGDSLFRMDDALNPWIIYLKHIVDNGFFHANTMKGKAMFSISSLVISISDDSFHKIRITYTIHINVLQKINCMLIRRRYRKFRRYIMCN